jgi:BirA family biotin operon repressor/biotin-[acetyl-CoA-carboxylase] ligase
LAEALNDLGVSELGLKWPNDIYREGKKLGGILVEVEGQIGTEVTCIIGAGININLPDNVSNIDQPFNDLSDCDIERNILCAKILNKLHQSLPVFAEKGLSPIVHKWNGLDVFAGRQVSISSVQQSKTGISKGINEQGALLLETQDGVEVIHGGEVSLRAN